MPPTPGLSVPPRCLTVGIPLVPLTLLDRFLGAWLELPSPSRWLIQMIRLGYAIQFARRPPGFRGVHATMVGKDAPVMRTEVGTLLRAALTIGLGGAEALGPEQGWGP